MPFVCGGLLLLYRVGVSRSGRRSRLFSRLFQGPGQTFSYRRDDWLTLSIGQEGVRSASDRTRLEAYLGACGREKGMGIHIWVRRRVFGCMFEYRRIIAHPTKCPPPSRPRSERPLRSKGACPKKMRTSISLQWNGRVACMKSAGVEMERICA